MPYFVAGSHEHVYEGFVFGLFLVVAGSTFKVTIEGDAGRDRLDMKVEKNLGPRCAIIELREVKEPGKMKAAAEEGLERICKMGYRAKLGADKMQLHEYGIGFYRKQTFVVRREMARPGSKFFRKADSSLPLSMLGVEATTA